MIKQPIIVDLQNFVNGVSNVRDLNISGSPQLVKCSLNLLENLPACRDLVFEFFSVVFDHYVGKYIDYIEVSRSEYCITCKLAQAKYIHRIPESRQLTMIPFWKYRKLWRVWLQQGRRLGLL